MDNQKTKQANLNNVCVKDKNEALNLLVNFVFIAQQRGAFRMDESAKCWECIQMLQNASPPQDQSSSKN
jgi:hypothetical protein